MPETSSTKNTSRNRNLIKIAGLNLNKMCLILCIYYFYLILKDYMKFAWCFVQNHIQAISYGICLYTLTVDQTWIKQILFDVANMFCLIFWKTMTSMKSFIFWLYKYWSLYFRVELMISWFRKNIVLNTMNRQQAICWTNEYPNQNQNESSAYTLLIYITSWVF